MMQMEELFRIWDRFEKSKATEFVFESDGQKVCLKKETAQVPMVQNIIPTAPMMPPAGMGPMNGPAMPPASVQTATVPVSPVQKTTGTAGAEIAGTCVKAPFVGTFYRSPAPGEDPFVILGQKVNKGDVIGIIEAMKLMNEITAPCDGTVTEIFAEDESLVEYDQILMSIGD